MPSVVLSKCLNSISDSEWTKLDLPDPETAKYRPNIQLSNLYLSRVQTTKAPPTHMSASTAPQSSSGGPSRSVPLRTADQPTTHTAKQLPEISCVNSSPTNQSSASTSFRSSESSSETPGASLVPCRDPFLNPPEVNFVKITEDTFPL